MRNEMKNAKKILLMAGSFATLFCAGCSKKQSSVWDDDTTASQMNKSGNSLWGNEDDAAIDSLAGPIDDDFIPLKEEDLKLQFADGAIPQPKETPGEDGSGLPGIDQFRHPFGDLAAVFRTLHFNTDDYILRGKDSLAAIDRIADYLKGHPKTFVFIAGHCDERGPQAYNLALGTRRANYVRTLLVEKGVDLNQLHTISYGKENPIIEGHSSEAWAKNRRAEFKIYQKP